MTSTARRVQHNFLGLQGYLPDAPLRLANAVLIVLALLAAVTHYEPRIGTPALVLLALVTMYGTIRTIPSTFRAHWPWILGLVAIASVHVGAGLVQGAPLQYFDRPIRPILAVLIFFYLARTGFREQWIWVGIGVTALMGAYIGLYEVFEQGAGRASAGRNANIYGLMMTIIALLTTWRAIRTEGRFEQWFFALCALAALTGALLSGSRAMWMVLAVFLSYLLMQIRSRALLRYALPSALALIAVAFLLTQGQVAQRWDRTVTEIQSIAGGDFSTSIGKRIQMWNTGLHLAAENPLTGVGVSRQGRDEALEPMLDRLNYPHDLMATYGHFHNHYIDQAVTYGVWGVIGLSLFFYGIVGRLPSSVRAPCLLVLGTLFISGFVDSSMESGRVTWLLLLMVSVLRLSIPDKPGYQDSAA